MPSAKQVASPFRITPVVFHVLLALSEGETHGYRIMNEVKERTRGRLKIGPGSLYFTLNRLLEAAMIEEASKRPAAYRDDSRRRYYRLTDFGRAVLESELSILADIVSLARERGIRLDASPA